MVLLERERELAELDDLIARAQSASGCAVAIKANAGLGKTRLLEEGRRMAAEAQLSVFSARATDLERDFTFGLLRQLFNHPLATLPEEERRRVLEGAETARAALGLGGGEEQEHDSFAVFHGLYWVTAALAERGPLLLAIDDLHWADTASLDYLRFLLPRLEELPVLLLVTARPDEPDPPRSLAQVLGDPVLRHLSPGPLSEAATTSLLTGELDHEPNAAFAAACFEISGGNPFLLNELARTLVEQGIEPTTERVGTVRDLAPEGVARSVLLRLEKLGPEALAVARALAVLGDGSDLRPTAELAGLELEAARDAADGLRAGAVLDADDSMRFTHPLVRNAVYSDLTAGERARTHGRAAALLRGRGAGPEEIATQLLAGEPGEDRAAVETLLEAAERALATGAPRSAITYLNRALGEPAPAELRAAILGPLLIAGARAIDHSVFAAIEPDVFTELERDPSLRIEWAVPLTVALVAGGRFEDAAHLLAKAVEVAVAIEDVEAAFRLEAQLNVLAAMVPSAPKVDLSPYADRIDPDTPGGRLAAAIRARSAIVDGTADEGAEAAKQALGRDGIIFEEEPELLASVLAVLTLVAADELDFAERAAKRSLAIAREKGATPELSRGFFLNGIVAWGRGDMASAETDIRQAMEMARMAGIVPLIPMYMSSLVEILVERDELELAEAELASIGLREGPVPDNPLFLLLSLGRGHLKFERGDLEGALEDLTTLAQRTAKLGLGPGPGAMGIPYVAHALVAKGEKAKAIQLTRETMAYVERWGRASSISHVMRAVAVTADGPKRVEILEEALAMLDGTPRLLALVQVLADLGEALRQEGRRVEAREPLREAIKVARRCGAVRVARRANAELEATGLTVRRYTPIGVESLTPSERRVAELAASGMTNRQIAQSLFVTVKTVESHLSAAYGKLDVGSRRELEGALEKGSSPRGASS